MLNSEDLKIIGIKEIDVVSRGSLMIDQDNKVINGL